MQNNLFEETIQLIEKYIKLYSKLFINKEQLLTESALESFVTSTRLVADDYFKDINNEIKIADFKKTIILFTDLKNSTKILKKCEKENILIYTAYMHYSTMLLAEILNLFQGTVIESTGDGTYSIISDKEHKLELAIDEFVIKNGEKLINYSRIKKHFSYFDSNELTYIFKERNDTSNSFSYDEKIRTFFFLILTFFDEEINNLEILKELDIKFLTRVGCKIGPCKITRLEIYQHISQDKLIGSIVHEAAHQASGK